MAARENAFETAVAAFPETIQTELKEVLEPGAVIPSERVASWLDDMSLDIGQLMIQLLPVAASYARVPISNYYVGAVAQGMPRGNDWGRNLGALYLGSNFEFRGEALSFTVHGEQSATNNAWLHGGETGLQRLAINAAPCGYCRQFLYELTTASALQILLKANSNPQDYAYTTNPLTYFLPQAFGPGDLGIQGGLMEQAFHGLTTSGGSATVHAALDGANASYAPYTKNYAGVALENSNGMTYVGRYAENAAYNPSMSPLESALALMNMRMWPQTPLDIRAAALVETQVDISQKDATEAVLSSIAPGVILEYEAAY